MSPVKVNAIMADTIGGKDATYSIDVHEKQTFLDRKRYSLLVNGTLALFSGISSSQMIVLKGDNLSTLDLLGLAASISTGASVEEYKADLESFKVTDILSGFGMKKTESDSANSELGIIRDCAVALATKRLYDDPSVVEGHEKDAQVLANKILDYYKGQYKKPLKEGGVSGVFSNSLGGFADYDSLAGVLGNITQTVVNNAEDTVMKKYLANLDTKWDDTNRYDSVRRAVLFLTEEDSDKYLKLDVVMGAKNHYGVDNGNRTKYINGYDEKNETHQILNSIIWNMTHNSGDLGDQNKSLAILSLIQQRGSSLSYSKNGIVDLNQDLKLSESKINPQAEANMKSINDEIEKVIKNSSLSDDESKILYTTGLRMQYAFYAMQYDGTLEENTATQLSLSESLGQGLRINQTIIPGSSYINNIQGYTMLNNIVDEISYAATITVPILGGVVTKTDLNTNSKVKLRYLRSMYDAFTFMRDKSNLVPAECLQPLIDAWNKKIEITIDGTKSETSLAETFDRLNSFLDLENLDMSGEIGTDKPLRSLFDSTTNELTPSLKYGIALSASYVPFKTNVYETITYKQLVGQDDFFNFHVLYGYYRKPLMIDTNISSVAENYTSGRVGTLKLCTLKELLQCEKEISLYTDDNFYNLDQLEVYKQEAIDREQKVKDTQDQNLAESLIYKMMHANDVDLSQVLKSGENEKYPTKMRGLTPYEKSKGATPKEDMEEIILDGDSIDKYLGNGDGNEIEDPAYSVMRAYAITSSVARDPELYDLIKNNSRLPVFKSSKSMAKIDSASIEWKSSTINYLLLKNIKSNMSVSYSSNLDLNKPVYMDVYGNIITESGFVVIPSASNATLNKIYEPYNAGFLTTYGKEYSLSADYEQFVGNSTIKTVLSLDDEGKQYNLQGTQEDEDVIDLSSVILSNEENVENLVNVYAENLDDNFNKGLYIPNVVMEVLRGAPLENVDKTKEGIVVGNLIGNNGVAQAAKLEMFEEKFNGSSQSAVLSLPNIAFYSGIEYLIPLFVKVTIIAVLIMTFKYIYLLGVKRQFSFREIGRYVLVLGLTISMVYAIPTYFNFSYYWSNKTFLQNDALTIAILNLEKKEAGLEVGVQDVVEAKPKTVLYLKMKDLDIPYYKMLRDISLSPISKSLTDIYNSYADQDLAFSAKNFKFIAGDLYISVDDLLDESTVTFNPTYRSLYDVTTGETPASFYTPYYVFLHQLTVNSNLYNLDNNIYSYSAQTYKDGKIKSLGLIKPYFESSAFKEDEDTDDVIDILHLKEIYGLDLLIEDESIQYSEKDLNAIRGSNWYIDNLTNEQFNERYTKINDRAKQFVAKHQDLLGRVSDETFLKMMSLDLALTYNKLFNVESANSLDIFNLASEDIARVAIASPSEVVTNSPLSFARFVYEIGGEVAIYFATILLVLFFLNSWISPIITIFVFIAIFASLFVRKIILEKQDSSIKGYIYITLYMGATCWGYAISMRLCTLLVSSHFTTAVNILILSIVIICNILMMMFIGGVVLMNWQDLGSAQFSETTAKIGHVLKTVAGYGNKMTDKMGQGFVEGKNKLTELSNKRKQRQEENKKKGLFEATSKDTDIVDDSRVGTGFKGGFRGTNQNTSKDRNRTPSYKYSGGRYVDIKEANSNNTIRITIEEFENRYGIEPDVNAKKDLTNRLQDKWDE